MIRLTDEEMLKVGNKGDEIYNSDDYLLKLSRLIAQAQLKKLIEYFEDKGCFTFPDDWDAIKKEAGID